MNNFREVVARGVETVPYCVATMTLERMTSWTLIFLIGCAMTPETDCLDSWFYHVFRNQEAKT